MPSPAAQASKTEPSTAPLPTIDCPLRKQGINIDHSKPFAEVEKYIAFLERPDRAKWQRPDAVVSQLGLKGTEIIADVGAGSGYFTFRLARKLPLGKVYAIDIDPGMLRHIHHRAMTEGVKNVEVAQSTADDPTVPRGVNLVFICDVLHHVKDRAVFLVHLAREVAPGTRLVVIEFKEGDLPQGPPAQVKISKASLISLLRVAGFRLAGENDDLPYQYRLELRR